MKFSKQLYKTTIVIWSKSAFSHHDDELTYFAKDATANTTEHISIKDELLYPYKDSELHDSDFTVIFEKEE